METVKRRATKVMEEGVVSTDHPVIMFGHLADAPSASMGGTCDSHMFRNMSSTLSRCEPITRLELAKAGVEAVSLYGGATVGARTMLDFLVSAAPCLVASGSAAEAAKEARDGADSTAKMMKARAGRSNYLSEYAEGHS